MEQLFETIETEDIEMTTTRSPNMAESIVKINFRNTFHHKNDPNNRYHAPKQAGYQINPDTTTNK